MDSARLPRILGAVVYDVIIVFSIIFIAAQWFPLVPESFQNKPGLTLFKQLYMLGISFVYFAYSWRRGGQTIGMKSWKIKLQQTEKNQTAIRWSQCAIRFLVAIVSWLAGGLGFIWILFNRQHKSWHDLASGTHLIRVAKKA